MPARLLRHGRQVAAGWSITTAHGRSDPVLAGKSRLQTGTYILRLRLRRRGHSVTISRQLVIA